MGNVLGHFFTGTAIACVLKLTTSVDDLIWFSPFLALCSSNAERLKCSLIYAGVCLIVTFGAIAIAFLANLGFGAVLSAAGNDGSGYWDAARVLSLVASVAIGAFAAKELQDWKAEEGNELPSWAQVTHVTRAVLATGLAKLGMRAELLPTSTSDAADDDDDDESSNNNGEGSGSPSAGAGRGSVRHRRGDDGRASGEQGLELLSRSSGEATLTSHEAVAAATLGRFPAPPAAAAGSAGATATGPRPEAVANPLFANVEVGDRKDSKDELMNDSAGSASGGSEAEELDSDEEEAKRTIAEARKSSARLFVVAFCGTLDDMTMFSAVILGKSIMMFSLVCGSMLATCIILAACWQISLYKPFADCIQKVPMWCLLSALSLYILVGGLLR